MSTLRDAITDARSRLDRAETWINSAARCRELGDAAAEERHLAQAKAITGEAYARMGRAVFAPQEGEAPKARPA